MSSTGSTTASGLNAAPRTPSVQPPRVAAVAGPTTPPMTNAPPPATQGTSKTSFFKPCCFKFYYKIIQYFKDPRRPLNYARKTCVEYVPTRPRASTPPAALTAIAMLMVAQPSTSRADPQPAKSSLKRKAPVLIKDEAESENEWEDLAWTSGLQYRPYNLRKRSKLVNYSESNRSPPTLVVPKQEPQQPKVPRRPILRQEPRPLAAPAQNVRFELPAEAQRNVRPQEDRISELLNRIAARDMLIGDIRQDLQRETARANRNWGGQQETMQKLIALREKATGDQQQAARTIARLTADFQRANETSATLRAENDVASNQVN